MVMRVHDIANRLARHETADLPDDGERTGLVQRCFHDRHEVLELDEHAVVGSACDAPHTICDFLRVDVYARSTGISHFARHVEVRHVRVDSNVADADIERVVRRVQHGVALVLVQSRREQDAVELAVFRVAHLEQHVAVDWIRHPCGHDLDEILIVDRTVDAVLIERRERDDGHFPAVLRQTVVGLIGDR